MGKFKNVIAGLAILGCGAGAMVGCTDVEIKQEQMDSVITEAEDFLKTQNDLDYETLVTNLNNYLQNSNQTLTESQVEQIVADYLANNQNNTIEYVYDNEKCIDVVNNLVMNMNEVFDETNITVIENLKIIDSFGEISAEGTYIIKNLYDKETKTLKMLKQFTDLKTDKVCGYYREIKNLGESFEITTYYIGFGVYNTRVVTGKSIQEIYSTETLMYDQNLYDCQEKTSIPKDSGSDFYTIKDLYGSMDMLNNQINGKRNSVLMFVQGVNNIDFSNGGDIVVQIDNENTNVKYYDGDDSNQASIEISMTVDHTYKNITVQVYQYMDYNTKYDVSEEIEIGNTQIDFDKTGYISVEEDQQNKANS